VFSHHGAADPLSNKVSDPFDLVAIFDHGGDRKAAARAVLPKQQSAVERLFQQPLPNSVQVDPIVAPAANPTNQAAVNPETPKKKIPLVMACDLVDEPVTWLIDKLVPAKGFVALYGKPGSYKSFIALYLASMIATGQEAFGSATVQGDVVYVAGEGGAGLKKRWDAVRMHYSLPASSRIAFVKAQLNLRSTDEDLRALVEAINEAGIRPQLVIVDTLARAFAGGNENSSEDMGAFIAICGAMQAALNSAVMIVHHSGKDEARGQRGHSSLLGAVDTELECVKISPEGATERIGQLTLTKQKDGEDGTEMGYQMIPIHLSDIDPENTSLVVSPTNLDEVKKETLKAQRPVKLKPREQEGLAALRQAIEADGFPSNAPEHYVPRGVRCAREGLFREFFYMVSSLDSPQAKRKAFQRVKDDLLAKGVIGHWGDLYWLIDRPSYADRPAPTGQGPAPQDGADPF
jgi:hypothetical protein